jgi:hypothetical protein
MCDTCQKLSPVTFPCAARLPPSVLGSIRHPQTRSSPPCLVRYVVVSGIRSTEAAGAGAGGRRGLQLSFLSPPLLLPPTPRTAAEGGGAAASASAMCKALVNGSLARDDSPISLCGEPAVLVTAMGFLVSRLLALVHLSALPMSTPRTTAQLATVAATTESAVEATSVAVDTRAVAEEGGVFMQGGPAATWQRRRHTRQGRSTGRQQQQREARGCQRPEARRGQPDAASQQSGRTRSSGSTTTCYCSCSVPARENSDGKVTRPQIDDSEEVKLRHNCSRLGSQHRRPRLEPRLRAAADGGCHRPAPARAGRGPPERQPEGRGSTRAGGRRGGGPAISALARGADLLNKMILPPRVPAASKGRRRRHLLVRGRGLTGGLLRVRRVR